MSNSISWLLEVEILPGKLDDFRAVARDLIAATDSESGTLDYEYHLSPDSKVAHVFERYADSAALLKHVASFANFAPRFMASCRPVHFSIYGNPSPEAKAALADLGPVYFSQLGGFSR